MFAVLVGSAACSSQASDEAAASGSAEARAPGVVAPAPSPEPEAAPGAEPEAKREVGEAAEANAVAEVNDAMEKTRQGLLAAAALEPGMVVADVGANHGWFADRVALALGPTGRVYATDIDPGALAALRELAATANPERAPIDVRSCAYERDTALLDLEPETLDLILMIDSLCFDGRFEPDVDVAYLHELRLRLRPGGRLLHHMDCACDVPTEGVIMVFEAAGFEAKVEQVGLPQPPPGAPGWTCTSDSQRRRHEQVLWLTRPLEPAAAPG